MSPLRTKSKKLPARIAALRYQSSVISLFAGCGGSSLGYQMAGYRELLAVEWDTNAAETFRLNFPDVPVFQDDIARLSVQQCLQMTGLHQGELDVLDGSPPCQGFSTAGRRIMEDPRNQLFREYVRLLRGLKPRVFVMENVSGMVKGKMKLIFAEIMRELKASGYRVKCKLLNAMYFDVPQSRERLIFIGVRQDLDREPTFPPAQTVPICAEQALMGVAIGLQEREMLLAAGKTHSAYKHWPLIRPGHTLAETLNQTSGFSCYKADPRRPSRTITKNDGRLGLHGAMHWAEQRRFTVNEFKRLASFPDTFRFAGDWSQSVSQIGNCVPPRFMRAIAAQIRDEILRDQHSEKHGPTRR